MSIVTILVTSILAIPIAVWLLKKWLLSYWQRRGLYSIQPDQKVNPYQIAKQKGLKHIGTYRFYRPIYNIVDLDLMKTILIKDFDYFTSRGVYSNPKINPLDGGLLDLSDDPWKKARTKLSPTFTSGKMKMMFDTMVDCINNLMTSLDKHAKNKTPVEAQDSMSQYTMDVIGSCAFGIDCNAVNDPKNSGFRSLVTSGGKITWKALIGFFLSPNLLKLMRYKTHDKKTTDFFLNLTKDMVDYRESKNVARKDFLQLLIQFRNEGVVTDSETLKKTTNTGKNHMSINEMAAHCFTFFSAGFSTSSSTLSLLFAEIALNQDVQEKLRQEIRETLQKHQNKISYDAVMSMEYLEKVICETLRKWPVARAIQREPNRPYKVPGSDLVLETGTKVMVGLMDIHRDPDYYPDPEKFDPERFTPENKAQRHPMAYIPFGEGPRICIGFRFAKLQMKVGLVTILNKYKITLNKKTKVPITLDPHQGLMAVDGGCWLDINLVDEK